MIHSIDNREFQNIQRSVNQRLCAGDGGRIQALHDQKILNSTGTGIRDCVQAIEAEEQAL